MRWWCLSVVAFVACGGGGGAKDTVGPDTGSVVDLSIPPWAVDGERGQVVLLDRFDTFGRRSVLGFAVFGDDLQGFVNPALCATKAAACIAELPGVGQSIDQGGGNFRPRRVDWSWVGDQVNAGPLTLGFVHDVSGGIAYYRRVPGAPVQSDARDISLGGEWSGVDAAFPTLPASGGLTSPARGERIDLEAPSVALSWEPGDGEVFLHLLGDGLDRVVHVEDSGSYTLDLTDLPELGPQGLTLHFVRWVETAVEVNGNQLSLVAAAEDQRGASSCKNPPVVDVVDNGRPMNQIDLPYYYGLGLTGAADATGALGDYYAPGTGEPTSAVATFTFYDFAIQPVCTARYDVSGLPAIVGPVTDSGTPVYWSVEIDPDAPSSTDCGSVPTWASANGDIRDYLKTYGPYSVGYGGLRFAAAPLQDFYGAGWPQVEPFFIGGLFSTGGSQLLNEYGYGYGVGFEACYQPDVQGVFVELGQPPLADLFIETLTLYVQYL